MRNPSRADACDLLCAWTSTERLCVHGRAVEACMAWKGTDKLGVPFDEHVMNVVAGLTTVRGELEL
ncbi:MAG TPA: hypothetical protein VIK13_00710 [Candidatus Limnocylindrales bacterium]|jgi:predicted hydrolase (HD superfamily)